MLGMRSFCFSLFRCWEKRIFLVVVGICFFWYLFNVILIWLGFYFVMVFFNINVLLIDILVLCKLCGVVGCVVFLINIIWFYINWFRGFWLKIVFMKGFVVDCINFVSLGGYVCCVCLWSFLIVFLLVFKVIDLFWILKFMF